MIELYYNNSLNCFQAYFNGKLIDDIISIKIESEISDVPRAIVTAFVEIVNTMPGK